MYARVMSLYPFCHSLSTPSVASVMFLSWFMCPSSTCSAVSSPVVARRRRSPSSLRCLERLYNIFAVKARPENLQHKSVFYVRTLANLVLFLTEKDRHNCCTSVCIPWFYRCTCFSPIFENRLLILCQLCLMEK